MFRIKVCGLTTPGDARMVAAAGADAVGLNFYPESRRSITLDAARPIVSALPSGIVKVGLFVNASTEEVLHVHDDLGLDLIQFHGDEPPELLASLGDRPVMRAFRLGPEGLRPVERYLAECERLGCLPKLMLIDAYQKGSYGGTGQVADWTSVQTREQGADRRVPPLVLAGGLTPDNVAEAIETVRPVAVDTASGVESSPGCKDETLVCRFVKAARAAFEELR